MSHKLVTGIYAAVVTPRHADDTVDVPAFRAVLAFLLSKGISSFAINGATGELCLTTPDQLRVLLQTVADVTDGTARVLCGVGGPSLNRTLELVAVAESCGVQALLLPMPYFFPYQQEDLDLFCRTVASGTRLPVLLYNLPQFTSGLSPVTVRSLISDVPNIIGIKDSSGSLDILRDLTTRHIDACRLVGNDSALSQALAEGVCDGVVSGVACALPELIHTLYSQGGTTTPAASTGPAQLLDEAIAQLNSFPTPWGIKWMLKERAILQPTFSLPVTPERQAQAHTMSVWFSTWRAQHHDIF